MKRNLPEADLTAMVVHEDDTEDGAVWLSLEDNGLGCITVRKRGEWHSDDDGDEFALVGFGELDNDIASMAEFIRALIARYNELVMDINRTAAECRMEPLRCIEAAPSD